MLGPVTTLCQKPVSFSFTSVTIAWTGVVIPMDACCDLGRRLASVLPSGRRDVTVPSNDLALRYNNSGNVIAINASCAEVLTLAKSLSRNEDEL